MVKVKRFTFTLPSPTFTFLTALHDTYYIILEHPKFLFSQNTMVKVGEGKVKVTASTFTHLVDL